jgi:hypothetical protein
MRGALASQTVPFPRNPVMRIRHFRAALALAGLAAAPAARAQSAGVTVQLLYNESIFAGDFVPESLGQQPARNTSKSRPRPDGTGFTR